MSEDSFNVLPANESYTAFQLEYDTQVDEKSVFRVM